jgi:hypothetical protein
MTRRVLVAGPPGLINGTLRPEAVPTAVVDLPLSPTGEPVNTIRLDLAGWTATVRAVAPDGTAGPETTLPAEELFGHLRPGAALRDLTGTPGALVPLFVIEEVAGADPAVHVYSQVRFEAADALFIRTTEAPVPATSWPPAGPDVLAEAVRLHRAEALFLNNHQRYYRKCQPDDEIEVKFTLRPPADIWDLTADAYERIAGGRMPGYVPEYRDEFQQWDYPTRLYEVTSPDDERGYVSFIPTPDGRRIVKRKWYTADAMIRRERMAPPERLPSTEDYVRSLGVGYRKLPAARRIRYDVNFESVATGHVYGIFFDHFYVVGAEHLVLSQCEIEYLRSRTVIAPDEAAVLKELDWVVEWTRALLDEREVPYELGYYSKLSFLRDCVDGGLVEGDPAPDVLP